MNCKTLTVPQAFGGLLTVLVAMKVLGALGLLDSPIQGLALAVLLGGGTRSVFDKSGAEADAGKCHEQASSQSFSPCGEDAPLDEEVCPYEIDFWAELQPDSSLDE